MPGSGLNNLSHAFQRLSSLPNMWYGTPNLYFLSITDFIEYCGERNFLIKKAIFLDENRIIRLFPNLFALIGIFLLSNS